MDNLLFFIIQTLISFYSLILIFRFLMQFFYAPFHPLFEFIITASDPVIRIFKKYIPGIFGYEVITIILSLALEMIILLAENFIYQIGEIRITTVFFLSFLNIIKTIIYIFMISAFLKVILLWINPESPVIVIFNSLTRPLIRKINKYIPKFGGMYLSYFILILICQILLIWPISPLEILVSKM